MPRMHGGRCRALMVLFLALCGLGSSRAFAQSCPGVYDPSDYEALAISSTAVPLTSAKIPASAAGLGMALVTVESNTVNFSVTGTPTASVGHQVAAGGSFVLCGLPTLQAFKAIRVSADATLKVTYFRSR